jgi:uncharacterized protein YdeI (YjbR/CyaY-like superfamily)
MPPPHSPVVSFRDQEEWRTWLHEHHADAVDGVWLKIAKKEAGAAGLTYAEALDAALCYGWIDGQKQGLDDTAWLQRFTPRRRRSIWSKTNVTKAEDLIASGVMQPSGLAEVERAKADGRWEAAYDGQRTATVPDDLAAALSTEPRAADSFAILDRRNRYAILHRLSTAKLPETRARRIATFVEMLARGDKLYP